MPGPWDGELSQDRPFYVATSELGRSREEGEGVPENATGAVKWYTKVASNVAVNPANTARLQSIGVPP